MGQPPCAWAWKSVRSSEIDYTFSGYNELMNCWASCLGDCSDKVSREHLVSEGLFQSDTVRVQGFSWCKTEPKEIGISGLTSKILCTHHNNTLSPVDEGGRSAFNTLREVRRVENVREKLKRRIWTVVRREINGLLLERWLLKTTINISYGKEYPIGREEGSVDRQIVLYALHSARKRSRGAPVCIPWQRWEANFTRTTP
jgi:hypothetical protein